MSDQELDQQQYAEHLDERDAYTNHLEAQLAAQTARADAAVLEHKQDLASMTLQWEDWEEKLQAATDRADSLQREVDELQQQIVCLTTDMPLQERLLRQRRTIHSMQAQREELTARADSLRREVDGLRREIDFLMVKEAKQEPYTANVEWVRKR